MKNRARLALLSLISSSQSFYSIGLIQKNRKSLYLNLSQANRTCLMAKWAHPKVFCWTEMDSLDCSIPTVLKPHSHCHLWFSFFIARHISASWFICPQGKAGCDSRLSPFQHPKLPFPSLHRIIVVQLHPRDVVPVTGALLPLGGDSRPLRTKPLPSLGDKRYGDTNSHK